MITVTFMRDKEKIVGFKSKGHAVDNHNTDNNSSSVCNWVSATTQSTLIGLQSICKLNPVVQMSSENGLLLVRLDKPTDSSEILMQTLHAVTLELRELYPNFIEIVEAVDGKG